MVELTKQTFEEIAETIKRSFRDMDKEIKKFRETLIKNKIKE